MFRNETQLPCQPEIVPSSPRGEALRLFCLSENGAGNGKGEPREMLTGAASEVAAAASQVEGEKTEIPTPTPTGWKFPQLPPLRQALLWLKSFRGAVVFPKQPQADARGQQRQKLREMGTYLQGMRHEQGLSLEAVASSTLIPLRLLRAIEVGDLDALPEPIYIRGFLKQFADTLGLDGSDFARAFPTASEIKAAAQAQRRVFYLPSFHVRPLHLYLFYLALVFLSVQGISYVLKQQLREVSAPPTPLPLPSLIAPSQQPSAGEPVPEKPADN